MPSAADMEKRGLQWIKLWQSRRVDVMKSPDQKWVLSQGM
jgi:hypothetical protein